MPASGDSATTPVSGEFGFNAPAEVVFGVLTDPDRTTRWLPRGMRTESAGPGEVRVRAGAQAYHYRIDVVADRLQVGWRPVDDAGPRGTARVRDAPAGGSIVHAELVVAGDEDAHRRARDLLAEAMRHLQRDVSDNFNAG